MWGECGANVGRMWGEYGENWGGMQDECGDQCGNSFTVVIDCMEVEFLTIVLRATTGQKLAI